MPVVAVYVDAEHWLTATREPYDQIQFAFKRGDNHWRRGGSVAVRPELIPSTLGGIIVTRYPVLFAVALLAGCASSLGTSSALAPTGLQAVVVPIQTLTQVQSRVSPATCDKAVKMLFRKNAGAS